MTTATSTNGLGSARAAPENGKVRRKADLPSQSDRTGEAAAVEATAPISGPPVPMPRRRRLRTFAFDPMSTRLTGRFLTISVPYETDLATGPQGRLLQVVDYDPVRRSWYALVDLDDAFILAQDGLQPSEGDPRSHQQIVYAVASSVIERFERYLGRRFRWRGRAKLALVPHAFEGRNAYFDPNLKAVLFGYYRADANDPGANLPGQVIFTCLSSDIIAHEVTHAMVDRLRPYFAEATNRDVFAWHEAFADLIALFQHFAYREVVLEAIASTSGSLEKGRALFDLASEFGQSTGRGAALRSAMHPPSYSGPQSVSRRPPNPTNAARSSSARCSTHTWTATRPPSPTCCASRQTAPACCPRAHCTRTWSHGSPPKPSGPPTATSRWWFAHSTTCPPSMSRSVM
jgi:hypothetical protein